VSAADAYAALLRLGVPVVETSDAAALLRVSITAAAKTLARLSRAGLIERVRHGTWWLRPPVDPLRLPPYLTAPLESYLSLQTALHLRGLIEQVPEVYYVVSLARTQRVVTCAGTFSVHHVAPEVFGGSEETDRGVRLATAEKALFDVAYLSAGRSRLFTGLPELTLPRGFREAELRRWLARVPSERARTLTERRLRSWLGDKRRSPS
jgi:predicted transcriptional regulator of viral defense system